MSEMCSVRPWPTHCWEALLGILMAGDSAALGSWIGNHVGLDPLAWDDLALAEAKFAADAYEAVGVEMARRSGITGFAGVQLLPMPGVETEPLMRDVLLLVTMSSRGDGPGSAGVIAAAREAGMLEELCGALGAAASQALQVESGMLGGVLVSGPGTYQGLIRTRRERELS